jgi:hypothetical protein
MTTNERPSNIPKGRLTSLESRLSGVLKPVPPRQEFVRDLSHRIQSNKQASLVNHVANWHFFAMLVASLFSLAVLVAVGVRAVLSLASKKRQTLGGN